MATFHQLVPRHSRFACGLWTLCCACAITLTAPAQTATAVPQRSASAGFETLDRVVAAVNGEILLASDVDAESRFQGLRIGCDAAVTPPSCAIQETNEKLLQRLIDQHLIREQMVAVEQPVLSDDQLDTEIAALAAEIPACSSEPCTPADQWARFLREQGFTPASFRAYWRQRQILLAFIDQRFRPDITVSREEIEHYYSDVLLPQYHAAARPAPPLNSIRQTIGSILTEQAVTRLLDDWLAVLRAQSRIVLFPSGVQAP